MKKIVNTTLYLLIALVSGCSAQSSLTGDLNDIYKGVEFEMPEVIEPVFPDYTVSIRD